jgi:hypothetical protein
MPTEDADFTPPQVLQEEALGMPSKVPLKDYREVMETLRDKGYSYQEIADWLGERLGVEINRHQIVYVVNMDPFIQNEEDENEANGDIIAEQEFRRTPIEIQAYPKKARKPRKKAKS